MKKWNLLLPCLLIAGFVSANNISISSVQQSGDNISFTLSWDNSWNTTNNINPLYPNNWDGVWLFIKYQNQIDNLWKHAKVSNTGTDHSVSGGGATLQVDAVTDSMGVFVRRTNAGSGNIANATVTLKMGPRIGTGAFNFKVFGIEMVHVPQGNFEAGDGTISTAYINPITINSSTQASGFTGGQLYSGSPVIPAAFPQGYNGYYVMKYEATNEQWVDFLNTLTYDQQATRIDVAPNAAPNTNAYGVSVTQQSIVEILESGLNNTRPAVFGCDYVDDGIMNTSNDGQNIPFLAGSKGDYLAYLDWSGLRPFTELEYEKACRGTRPRVQFEYAWGSTTINPRTRANLINSGQASEASNATVVDGQAICNSGNPAHGAARSGVFATVSSGRESSGASFYGIMELTGNLWEFMVTAGNGGTNFAGAHGDGKLATNGDADMSGWPQPNDPSTTASGLGYRGGSWWETSNYNLFTRMAYRSGVSAGAGRSSVYGMRGARSFN